MKEIYILQGGENHVNGVNIRAFIYESEADICLDTINNIKKQCDLLDECGNRQESKNKKIKLFDDAGFNGDVMVDYDWFDVDAVDLY